MKEQPINYDDPAMEEQWCTTARKGVAAYLATEGLAHAQVGKWPAWHVAPVASVWAIESLVQPGRVGWWVLFGDMPTDYVSGAGIDHPREAMRTIAGRWKAYMAAKETGSATDDISFGGRALPDDLVPLLESRAETLRAWADDDELWDAD